MQIKSSDLLAGIPVLKIRNLMKKLSGSNYDIEGISNELNVNIEKTQQVIETLIHEGYIESQIFHEEKYWTTTLKGNSLGLASAAKPILRSTADKKIKQLLERVLQVNNDGQFLYYVIKVLVFGSYLSDKENLGDIDIAVKIVPKEQDKEKQFAAEKNKTTDAINNGRNFSNFFEQLIWPQTEVLKYLKSHSRSISLHTTEDEILKQVDFKVIYEKE